MGGRTRVVDRRRGRAVGRRHHRGPVRIVSQAVLNLCVVCLASGTRVLRRGIRAVLEALPNPISLVVIEVVAFARIVAPLFVDSIPDLIVGNVVASEGRRRRCLVIEIRHPPKSVVPKV